MKSVGATPPLFLRLYPYEFRYRPESRFSLLSNRKLFLSVSAKILRDIAKDKRLEISTQLSTRSKS